MPIDPFLPDTMQDQQQSFYEPLLRTPQDYRDDYRRRHNLAAPLSGPNTAAYVGDFFNRNANVAADAGVANPRGRQQAAIGQGARNVLQGQLGGGGSGGGGGMPGGGAIVRTNSGGAPSFGGGPGGGGGGAPGAALPPRESGDTFSRFKSLFDQRPAALSRDEVSKYGARPLGVLPELPGLPTSSNPARARAGFAGKSPAGMGDDPLMALLARLSG